jgi:DNA invertase Pin-like site-specific DNA recombinase
MTTTACYVRCSTAGQNEASQKREIERWLKGNGVKGVLWFVDKKSGDNLKRPGFERLQAAVFAGEVKTIVCYKIDRISRTLRDGINVLVDWCERGLRVVSVTQQLDFNDKTGPLIASVLFAVAQMEQETRRERQRAGIDAIMNDPTRCEERKLKYAGRRPKAYANKNHNAPAEALRLRKENKLTDAEIAKQLDVSRATVQRYLHPKQREKKTAVA